VVRGQLKSRATQTKRGKKSRQGAFGFGFDPHWLKNWRDIFKPITKRSNHDRVITFDSHLKTVLVRVCELVTVLRDTFVDHDELCCCLVFFSLLCGMSGSDRQELLDFFVVSFFVPLDRFYLAGTFTRKRF